MRKITFWQRVRYSFDNSLSGGTGSLIGWLAVISPGMVLAATILKLFSIEFSKKLCVFAFLRLKNV